MGRAVAGLNAYAKGKALGKFHPKPAAVRKKREALAPLAQAYLPDEIAERAYDRHVRFRPEVPAGVKGWGAAGVLDLAKILSLARQPARP